MNSSAGPTPFNPMWLKPDEPSADQAEAEARAAELGAIMRDLLSGPDGPAMAALMNAEFARRGCLFRIARKGGPPPRR